VRSFFLQAEPDNVFRPWSQSRKTFLEDVFSFF
jgi:hypothetical protein